MPLVAKTHSSDMSSCMLFRNLGEDEKTILDLFAETGACQMMYYSSFVGLGDLACFGEEGARPADLCHTNDSKTLPVHDSVTPWTDVVPPAAHPDGTDSLLPDPPARHSTTCFTTQKSRRRKNKPMKSAMRDDPDFVGVTIRMRRHMSGGQCRLLISSFSHLHGKHERRREISQERHSGYTTPSSSASGSESEGTTCYSPTPEATNVTTGKSCSSCKTRQTPMWRDAEDGTPLCNACGIRYKKYRSRCPGCWHIPHKKAKPRPFCPKCGSSLRLSFTKKFTR